MPLNYNLYYHRTYRTYTCKAVVGNPQSMGWIWPTKAFYQAHSGSLSLGYGMYSQSHHPWVVGRAGAAQQLDSSSQQPQWWLLPAAILSVSTTIGARSAAWTPPLIHPMPTARGSG